MNDYLWDKTGSDPLLEELELELKEFRSGGELPRKVKIAEANQDVSFWKRFHLPVAIPSFAALSLALIWFVQSGPVLLPKAADDVAAISGSEKILPPENPPIIVDTGEVAVVPSKQPHTSVAKKKAIKINHRKPAKKVARLIKRPAARVSAPALTEEEKFAYSQLMKALAITSSKLQLVKEKVGGPEKPNGSK